MKLTGQTILIADDNGDDRFFIERALKRLGSGLSAQFVASGAEAVAYLKGTGAYVDRHRFPYPSFVITDCEMPDGDGFCVLSHLQARAPAHMKVMMLSSSDNPEDVRRAYTLGATSYATKSADPSALVSVIAKFLEPPPPEAVHGLLPMRLA